MKLTFKLTLDGLISALRWYEIDHLDANNSGRGSDGGEARKKQGSSNALVTRGDKNGE